MTLPMYSNFSYLFLTSLGSVSQRLEYLEYITLNESCFLHSSMLHLPQIVTVLHIVTKVSALQNDILRSALLDISGKCNNKK